jgi:hypothetical protein
MKAFKASYSFAPSGALPRKFVLVPPKKSSGIYKVKKDLRKESTKVMVGGTAASFGHCFVTQREKEKEERGRQRKNPSLMSWMSRKRRWKSRRGTGPSG